MYITLAGTMNNHNNQANPTAGAANGQTVNLGCETKNDGATAASRIFAMSPTNRPTAMVGNHMIATAIKLSSKPTLRKAYLGME
jgi:hypothetical protein